MTPDELAKWTPERRAALRRTIAAARRFVECADEFVPDDGTWFYPDALGEYGDALNDAIEAEAHAWDEGTPGPRALVDSATLREEIAGGLSRRDG